MQGQTAKQVSPERYAHQRQDVVDGCIGGAGKQDRENANTGVGAFGNLLADPTDPTVLFQAGPPPPNHGITNKQMQEDGYGDDDQAPDCAEANARGDVENADRETNERENQQHGERRPTIHFIGPRVDRRDVDLLMNQREDARENDCNRCDPAPRQFAEVNAARATLGGIYLRRRGVSR